MEKTNTDNNYVIACLLVLLCFAILLLIGHFTRPSAAAQDQQQTVDLVLDHGSGSFRFFIDGREVARIDRDGLRVRNDIEYGGTITNTGVDHFDRMTQPQAGAQ